MNTAQKDIKTVIEETREVMVRDGISESYIKNLSYTWNALLSYVKNGNPLFSEELCWQFLSDQYSICRKQNFLALRAIDKRRKRAILVLINMWNYGNTSPGELYQPCRFSGKCENDFQRFLIPQKAALFNDYNQQGYLLSQQVFCVFRYISNNICPANQ